MRVFLDQDVPHNIRRHLKPRGHEVVTAFHQGWSEMENGDLLQAIEQAGFEVLVTADQNLEYQQNLAYRKIALVVLGNGNWPIGQNHLADIVSAVDAASLTVMPSLKCPCRPSARMSGRTSDCKQARQFKLRKELPAAHYGRG